MKRHPVLEVLSQFILKVCDFEVHRPDLGMRVLGLECQPNLVILIRQRQLSFVVVILEIHDSLFP